MNIYKELDTLIKDRCTTYVREPDLFGEGKIVQDVLNENSYMQLRDEISEYKGAFENGTLEFEQLSPIAQDIVAEWEGMVEDYAQRQHDQYAEAPEDF